VFETIKYGKFIGLLGGTMENVSGNKINASLKICYLFIFYFFWSSSCYFLLGTIIINIPNLVKKYITVKQNKKQ